MSSIADTVCPVDELEPGDRWLTVAQAAEVAGVHPSTIRRWADDQLVEFIRTPGNQRRFRLFAIQEVMRLVKRKRQEE